MVAAEEVTADVLWHLAAAGLAEVLVSTSDAVLQDAAGAGGDLRIKSKDAEVVISFVEEQLGDVELVDQSHLGRRELTSLRTLSDLLWRRWCEIKGDEEAS
jgi:hypothetical protein